MNIVERDLIIQTQIAKLLRKKYKLTFDSAHDAVDDIIDIIDKGLEWCIMSDGSRMPGCPGHERGT